MKKLMKKLRLLTLTCLCFGTALHLIAQEYDERRYRHQIFSDISAQLNVKYGKAPVWTIPYNNTDLKMDVYAPTDDDLTNRPLIIFAHAGGFLNGSKDVDDMVALCDSFARKGYVTASLAYRKGYNPLDAGSATRGVYRGIQDGRAAVRYFKEHATTYGIDTNFIYFGGMSAGGFMALHLAYMDDDERPSSTYSSAFGIVPDLGCLDCAGNNYSHSAKVRAIMNFWGAIQDTAIIGAGDTPLLQMHGINDPTIPYVNGHPFGLPTVPKVHGSSMILQRVNNLGIYNEFYSSPYPNRHMQDGSDNGTWDPTPSDFWYDTLLPKTTDFLVTMTKSQPTNNNADTLYICSKSNVQVSLTPGTPNGYYRWLLHDQDQTTEFDTHSSTLDEQLTSGSYDISVVEFNQVHCASDTLWLHVIKIEPNTLTADFEYTVADDSIVHFTNLSTNAHAYQWQFGNGVYSTEFEPTCHYTESGTYTVSLWVDDEHNCEHAIAEQTVEILLPGDENIEPIIEPIIDSVIPIVGLEDIAWTNNIAVFPNPFNNVLSIENTNDSPISVELYDLNGQLLIATQTVQTSCSINVQSLTNGVYFLRMTSDNGTNTIRLVKN